MEKTVDAYKTKQAKTLELLTRLSEFLQQGEEAGLEIEANLKEKLKTVIQSVSGDKLKIALIGGFSEGKTAIAAAWMERLDKSSMKISHLESSDEVKVYDIDANAVLIDTPGLFGFKEKMNEQTHKIEKYKEITEKYVSEAHLILYVMNSTNPVKDSHKEELHWLFQTLNLLPRTVFVLSRFDEVADVEDEQDYQAKLKVKRSNVRDRLKELIQLSEKEVIALPIVAVSANPFDMGMEHWLGNLPQFKTLSRITTLQDATLQKIQASGGHARLVAEAQKSVIGDVLNRQLPLAIANDEDISKETENLAKTIAGLNKKMESTSRQISEARTNLRDFVTRHFSDLILQANGTSLETFDDFFERNIGSEGIVLSNKLQSAFDKHLQSARLEVEKMETSFNLEIDHFSATLTKLGKQGVGFLKNSGWINKSTILATRDGVVSTAKMVGLDLNKWMKFKPYGATNLAKGLSGTLAVVGIGLEAWDSWKEHQRAEAFKAAIKALISDFERQRKELSELITGPQFEEQFFGHYLELQKSIQRVQDNLKKGQERQQKFRAWRKQAEMIDAEFRELSA